MEKERHTKKAVSEKRFPLAEEELTLGKRRVENGITRVTTKVTDNEQVVEQPLMKENVDVRHVAINRLIDSPVQTRTEGDTIIVPVMEEVLVVEKKVRAERGDPYQTADGSDHTDPQRDSAKRGGHCGV